MLNYTFIPFLLALNVSIPKGTTHFDAEYSFDFNKTTVVFREPLQITQLTAQLTCQPFLHKTLRCFIQNVTFLTTLRYQNLYHTEEISKEHIKSEQWFDINFDEQGVMDILVHKNSGNVIRRIMKKIANQFNLGGDMLAKLYIMHFPSCFTITENTSRGTCNTKYKMHMVYGDEIDEIDEIDEEQDSKFQIIPFVMAEEPAFKQRGTRISIEKNVQSCEYSLEFESFLNGMEVSKYMYTMELVNDKITMSTVMDVQLPPDPWNLAGSPVFTETTLLNLINIISPQTIASDESHTTNWITILI